VLLEKNPRFFDAANVALKRIYYYPTDDYSAALQRMRAGELDEHDRIPVQRIDWINRTCRRSDNAVSISVSNMLGQSSAARLSGCARAEAINLRNRKPWRGASAGSAIPRPTSSAPNMRQFSRRQQLSTSSDALRRAIERARALMRAAAWRQQRAHTHLLTAAPHRSRKGGRRRISK
jgi:hypothetical protein